MGRHEQTLPERPGVEYKERTCQHHCVQGQNRATNTPPIDPGKLFKGADGKALSIWLQVLMPNPQRTRIKKLILNNGGKLARNKVDIDYCVICPRNTSHAKDVETMRAYKKPIVLPQWIEECCQQNKLLDWTAFDISPLVRDQKIPVKTEVMPIDLSSPPPAPRPKHGTSKGRAARTSFKAPSEPGPPTPHQTMHSSGAAVFTAEDVTYLRKFLRWILFHNERTTIATISRELGIRTSHHSAASWERYMHRHNHLLLETKAWVERRKTGQPEPSNRHPILVVD
ncbi:hypothetical protein SISSUDRAFT_866494 [Sistotremastrum suecicum HHB10207 ss-3]|uniref:DNA-binding protein RAP1 n=1 Tax=Sistotremastrum suecicum HHB10207 ss-3 TaxID=1314776 RepID=A0A166CG75_9AGAM|nr:hypothetical protein SISSUDRAFT_866494 [Sistotremastrum suecicum HHB10207 ss-3]